MTVHPRFRGKNVAVSMIDCLLGRLKTQGWEQVRARAMFDGEPQAFYPTISFWLRMGFTPAGPVRSFGPSRDPIDQANATDLMLDLKDWNPRRGSR